MESQPGNSDLIAENDGTATHRSPLKKLASWMRSMWLVIAVAGWSIGSVLQIFVRDSVNWIAPVFYALPWPIIVGFGVVAVISIRRKHARVRWILGLIVLVQLASWLNGSISSARMATDEPRLRFMFWNVCRGLMGYEHVANEINASNADVVAMVEATHQAQTVEFWKAHCPDYQPYRLGSGMFVLIKGGQVIRWDHGSVHRVTRYRILDLSIRDYEFSLLLMDVVSDPLVNRGPAIKRLQTIARLNADKPFLVAGDFNTPPESTHFDELRNELSKAYEICGEGFRETWPVIAPVLDLDQVWGNDHIRWQRCWRGWSLRSDHRPVFVELATQAAD
jgi:vancomycin resistance protein VanJ